MLTIKENTTLIGVSELRKGIEKILKMAQRGLVIIEKRHKPAAILLSNDEYEHIQRIVETAEDIVLGAIAQERFEHSNENDYVDIEKFLK